MPGRRVPAMRSFELFLNLCRSSPALEKLAKVNGSNSFSLNSKVIRNVNADQVADKTQRNLYFAVDDINVDALMGKWHSVGCLWSCFA